MPKETFYPEDNEEEDSFEYRQTRERARKANEPVQEDQDDPPFTLMELKTAVKTFNPKKAPGADGFAADICRQVIDDDP